MNKILIALTFCAALPSLASDSWNTLRPLGRGFSILFPSAPEKDSPDPNQWIGLDSQKRLYSVSAQSATPGLEPSQAQLEQVMASLAQSTNGTLTDKRFFKFRDFQACEFKVRTSSGQISATRIIVTSNRRYVLGFVSSTRNFDGGVMRKYFDSLEFAKPTPTPSK